MSAKTQDLLYHKLRAKWPKDGIARVPSPEVANAVKESKRFLKELAKPKPEPREEAPF